MKIELPKRFYYRVQPGECYLDLCSKFNTCKENILRNNEEIDLYAGEWIIVIQNDYKMHIVKPAETLEFISQLYNIEKTKLLSDNNLENEKLFIGQLLKIKSV